MARHCKIREHPITKKKELHKVYLYNACFNEIKVCCPRSSANFLYLQNHKENTKPYLFPFKILYISLEMKATEMLEPSLYLIKPWDSPHTRVSLTYVVLYWFHGNPFK